jgi:hypothetical protein
MNTPSKVWDFLRLNKTFWGYLEVCEGVFSSADLLRQNAKKIDRIGSKITKTKLTLNNLKWKNGRLEANASLSGVPQ